MSVSDIFPLLAGFFLFFFFGGGRFSFCLCFGGRTDAFFLSVMVRLLIGMGNFFFFFWGGGRG